MQVTFLPESHIVLDEDRIRKTFDEKKAEELKQSIQEIGLINPLVVDVQNDIPVLVAGERRLRAMRAIFKEQNTIEFLGTQLPVGHVPVLRLSELPEDQRLQIELEENTARQDITWQERMIAIKRLHELRKKNDPTWNVNDTAAVLERAPSRVETQLHLADALDTNPAIAKAKSEKEAAAIWARETEALFYAALAENRTESKPEVERLRVQHISMEEGMASLSSESINIILTDPPYGENSQNYVANCTWRHRYDDSWGTVRDLLRLFAAESYRVAAKEAHLYAFCGFSRFAEFAELLSEAGWDVWSRPLIWVKDVGHIPKATLGPKYCTEYIIYANKGDRPTVHLRPDALVYPTVKDKDAAAQKPVDVYRDLLSRSARPGDTVLDPFCGSGTIFPAADHYNLHAIGFDRDPSMVGLAQSRIKQLEGINDDPEEN